MKEKDKFNFGKYKGETLEYVWNDDPDYIIWCVDNVEGFKIEDKWMRESYADYLINKSWDEQDITEQDVIDNLKTQK